MWFQLTPCDADTRLPYSFETIGTLPAPPERVFEILADIQSWPR